MSFPIVKCATEGFRVAGKNPGALVVWALYYLLTIAVFVGILFAFAGPAIMDMARNPTGMAQSDPAAMMALMGKLGLGYLLGIVVMLFMVAALLGAIFRAVLMPQDGGFAYLKFGGREVKLALSSVLIGLIMLVVFMVLGGVIGVIAVATLHGSGNVAAMMGPMMLMRLVIYAAALLLWTGFSMSYPAAFMQNGVRVFQGWKVAGKNFWSLLLCYLLVIVICVAMFVALIVVLGVMFAAVGVAGGMSGMSAGGLPALGPGIIIVGIVSLVLYMLVGVLCAVLIYAAQAAAYRELTGTDQLKAF